MAQPPASSRKSSLSSAFASGKYSDCTVKCEQRSWRCHKVVLCTRSAWFAAAFDGKFKESKKKIVKIEEEKPEDVAAMLEYLYDDRYTLPPHVPGDNGGLYVQQLIHHASLYAMGDLFLIPGLKTVARTNLRRMLESLNATSTAVRIVKSVLVRNIYSSTPGTDRGLRDAICQYLKPHLAALLEGGFIDDMLKDVDGFALDLLRLQVIGSCVPRKPAREPVMKVEDAN